jgi:hypothetical protein
MGKYRKKPIVIEAWQVVGILNGAKDEWKSLPPCIAEAYERGDVLFFTHEVHIKTLEGWMIGRKDEDSWIIKGVKGELYPCKGDIFEATYETA